MLWPSAGSQLLQIQASSPANDGEKQWEMAQVLRHLHMEGTEQPSDSRLPGFVVI